MIRYTADVFCDNCGCWIHGIIGSKPSGLARPALAEAKRHGWSRDVKSIFTDLCPTCLKKHQRGEL